MWPISWVFAPQKAIYDPYVSTYNGSTIKRTVARRVIDEVVDVVADWPRFGADAGVPPEDIRRIARTHRLALGAERRGKAVET